MIFAFAMLLDYLPPLLPLCFFFFRFCLFRKDIALIVCDALIIDCRAMPSVFAADDAIDFDARYAVDFSRYADAASLRCFCHA